MSKESHSPGVPLRRIRLSSPPTIVPHWLQRFQVYRPVSPRLGQKSGQKAGPAQPSSPRPASSSLPLTGRLPGAWSTIRPTWNGPRPVSNRGAPGRLVPIGYPEPLCLLAANGQRTCHRVRPATPGPPSATKRQMQGALLDAACVDHVDTGLSDASGRVRMTARNPGRASRSSSPRMGTV
jgi:hypothetical protein